MTGLVIVSLVLLALLVLGLVVVARRLWRLYRGEEEMEAGGSLGQQFVGRYERDA